MRLFRRIVSSSHFYRVERRASIQIRMNESVTEEITIVIILLLLYLFFSSISLSILYILLFYLFFSSGGNEWYLHKSTVYSHNIHNSSSLLFVMSDERRLLFWDYNIHNSSSLLWVMKELHRRLLFTLILWAFWENVHNLLRILLWIHGE